MRLAVLAFVILFMSGCSKSPQEQATDEMNFGIAMMGQAREQAGLQRDTGGDWDKMTLEPSDTYNKALAHYDKAIQLNPKLAPAYYHRGFAYLSHGDTEKAVSDFSKAIELNPKYAEAYLMRSRAFEALGDVDRSEQDRQKALELKPDID